MRGSRRYASLAAAKLATGASHPASANVTVINKFIDNYS
jgi:hypothetical protein